MYKLFFLALLCVSVNAYSQTTIKGIVKNSDNEPIPYCSIGMKNTTIGTISDENGNYKFTIPDSLNHEIVFSAIGYTEKKRSKDELAKKGNIILDYHSNVLETVVINAKKMKEKLIGQKSKPMLTFSRMFKQNMPSIEQGNIFDIEQKTRLKSYNFYIIPSSRYQQITLKLNIYSVENNIPDKVLLNQNIIYETTTTGWQKIDLSQYNLAFNDLKQIAVTLQLVNYRPLDNIDFVFGVSAKKSLSKNLLFRHQSQENWEKNDGVFITNLEVAYSKDN